MPFPFRIAAFVFALTVAVGVADDGAGPAGNFSGSLTFEHDRDAAEGIAQAEQELAAGQTAAGLSRLQQLLDRSADVLIEDGTRYVSVWEAANHILARLAPAERASYERITEDSARHQLEQASHPVDRDRLARLTIRYRHAAAGPKAAVLLASLAFDRGEWDQAAAWCELARRITDGRTRQPGLLRLDERIHAVRHAETTERQPTTSDPPADAEPSAEWSLDLGVAPRAARAIDSALAEFDAQAMTATLVSRPIVVEGRIVTRTLTGLVCIDAATGKLLWTQTIADHASRLARGPGELNNPVRNGQVSATLLRRLVRDSLQDELSTDGQVVYTVITGERPTDAESTEPTNVLRAVEVASGKTTWELGPPQTPKKRFAKKLEPRFFLGPPLVDGTQRLVLTQRRQSVELVALSAEDGGTLWSLPVGQAVRDLWAPLQITEDTPPYDRERQSTACRLSRSGSRVLCSTAAGAFVCIDTLSRRVLWAYRYARHDLPRQPTALADATHFREMPISDSFPTADCWQSRDVGVCVAPDADRIFAFHLDTGELLWSRPRGDGIQVLPGKDGDLILLGESLVQSLRFDDGSQSWFTPIPRPAGTGLVMDDAFVVPLEAGGQLVIQLTDGTIIASPAEADDRQSFTIAAHPPTGLRPIDVRNLAGEDGLIVSQSPTVLERISRNSVASDENSTAGDAMASSLVPLRDLRSSLEPTIGALRRVDSRILLADDLLLGVLEQVGLRQSIEEQASALLHRLDHARSTDDGELTGAAYRQLRTLHPDMLYLTTGDGLHSCRLDRWLDADSLGGHRDEERPVVASPADDSEAGQGADVVWPEALPTVTEEKTHFGESHFLQVPMQVDEDGSWRDVSVEIDRLGRMIQFCTAERIVPMAVSLPAEVGTLRAEVDFLQAWGIGDVLLVRVGLELVAFERRPGGELPDAPLWPARGKTLALAGPNPPLASSIREVSDAMSPAWNQTSSGWEDVFGRRLSEIGPVCTDYFCHQERGHLIAVDTHTGHELWRRSRLPVGTWSIGDERHVVLFRADSPVVTVLDTFDGRTTGTWRLDESLAGPAALGQSPFEPRIVNGTVAVSMLPTADGGQLRCIDMLNGQAVWQRDVAVDAHVFAVSESLLGVVEPSESGRVAVTFLNWSRGEVVGRFDVQGPEELADIVTFRDAGQVYLITSGKITDLRLLNARQIRGGANRQAVNGWLHAFHVRDAAHMWSQPVENMAFPTVQPRHVPLLLINDQVHAADQNSPQGRLICLDKRTGETVASLTHPLHIYYTLAADVEVGRISIRMQGRTLRLDYRPK